jgi:multidrug efflux pump subunit AcrA (membrane-fusion protein)
MFQSRIRVVFLTAAVLFAALAVTPFIVRQTAAQGQDKGKEPARKDAKGTVTLPITVQAFESVHLYSRLSGEIKSQSVDIGDRAKRGQVLAVIDRGDLEAQLKHDRAALEQAKAQVKLAKARVAGAEAELEAVKLAVDQAQEAVNGAVAQVRFRGLNVKRMEELARTKSIDLSTLDEARQRHETAVAAERSAKSAVRTVEGQVRVGMAKVEQAGADLVISEAGVKMAEARLDRTEVLMSQATVIAPFDGIITERGYFSGAFVRAADLRIADPPLFEIQRIDRMRLVGRLPERDTPFVDPGDPVEIEIDALPGKKWTAKVSRMASALDPRNRTMLMEIDLPNSTGLLRPGMSGSAKIDLGKRNE